MTPERWQQIKDVLHRAIEVAPPDRAAFLAQACAGDQSLREEVESFLASDEKGRSSFLQSPPILRLMKGTRLGDYEIQSLLGAGGMGEVYRARDPRLRRDVAIKVLPSFVSTDPERLRRFEQEATAAAALNHPNILAVYQMGTYEGAPYLVSELLEGETLREQVRRGRIAVRKAIDYAVQIARGLAAAHDKGIVHRDLKPENLFVTKDGRVKILDFGLAKLIQPQHVSEHSAPTMGGETEPGVVMGTVGYMSPEQVRGQNADYHADIFAFGAVLYEMLSGKRAFQSPTSAETMTAILNEDPPGISQLVSNLPPGLQRVVHRCLEKSPEQRFQSASDLAFALEALSDSGSGFLPARPLPNKGSRRWMLFPAALAVAVLAAFLYHFRSTLAGTMSPAPTGPATITKISHWNKPMDQAVMSPDGRTVAFTSPVEGFDQVFVMLTSGAEPLQLTKDSTDKVVDNFSADGNEIYFIQTLGSDEIWAVPTLGGNTRRIAAGTNLVSSTDGKYFFYEKPSEDAVMRAPQSGGAEELVHSFQGDKSIINSLLLYPDGTNLLVGLRKEAGKTTFRKLDIATREQQDLGEVSDVALTPSWGVSGKTLYLSRTVNGLTNVWEYSLSDHTLNQVTSGPGPDYNPMGDPAGKGVYFVNGKNSGILRVYHVASKLSNDLETEDVSQPEISPDGRHVAYITTPETNKDEIWVSELDGNNRVRVAGGRSLMATLDWSPDGTRLPVLSGVGRPGARLSLIEADGSHLVQSPWSGSFIGFIAWERDGKSFYFSDSDNPQAGGLDGKIWRADANGADLTRLGENCGWITDVSPDHRYLMSVVLFGGKTGIYQFSISDGKCTLLKDGVATFTARFAADGKSFVYSNTSTGETSIFRQPWQAGKMVGSEKPVLKFPLAFRAGSAYLGNSYDVSRDLSTIVYARPGGHADLYFLRRN